MNTDESMTDAAPTQAAPGDNHCVDCCCARSWTALGVTAYDGKSIPEHITTLLAERDALRELMNVYNLGGWTDAVAPMKRALAAESALAAMTQRAEAAERDAARYRWWRDNYGVERDYDDSFKLYTLVGTNKIGTHEQFDAAIDIAIAVARASDAGGRGA